MVSIPVIAILIFISLWQLWITDSEPQNVLAKAMAAAESITSFRATSRSSLVFPPDEFRLESECEFVFPDRVHLKITMEGQLNEYIIIGDMCYFLASNKIVLASMAPFFEVPSKLTTQKELESAIELQQLPDEAIDGQICFHYKGIDETDMETMVELWIGRDDYLVREIIRTAQGDTSEPRITRYYDFNEPIIVEAPKTESGDLLLGWKVVHIE